MGMALQWEDDADDMSLLDLAKFLEAIANHDVQDVRPVLQVSMHIHQRLYILINTYEYL